MNGFESPTSVESTHAVFRLSWLAYANTVMTIIFFIVVSIAIGQWTAPPTLNRTQPFGWV
ncbi:hypothetical protein PSYPI_06573 [Pseudomonas syringae pv. pisi str. 1704B]|uniref:Uncharacterized protein n=1 Tax=Pseudomonas syringae pv. pisi str. 1704B TaxID=629263 RepID=F3G4T5_PSESJ|nr:hypothetical protein PSYPI_06573 [Pseudomonas syringae pv. pisi str. 1704B]